MKIENALTRFSDRVADYLKYRPGYPPAVIERAKPEDARLEGAAGKGQPVKRRDERMTAGCDDQVIVRLLAAVGPAYAPRIAEDAFAAARPGEKRITMADRMAAISIPVPV